MIIFRYLVKYTPPRYWKNKAISTIEIIVIYFFHSTILIVIFNMLSKMIFYYHKKKKKCFQKILQWRIQQTIICLNTPTSPCSKLTLNNNYVPWCWCDMYKPIVSPNFHVMFLLHSSSLADLSTTMLLRLWQPWLHL